MSEALGNSNLITADSVERQIEQAVALETSKGFYTITDKTALAGEITDQLSGLHALLQKEEVICRSQFGIRLTIDRLSGEGIAAINAVQTVHMASPQISLELATEGPLVVCELGKKAELPSVRDEPFVITLYESRSHFTHPAAVETAITENPDSLQNALFIGNDTVNRYFLYLQDQQLS